MEKMAEKSEVQSTQTAVAPWAHLRLPPFPKIALRVLQLSHDENVQLHQLSELISSDAAFATEVLTIANSLVYAPRFPARTILQAIAVLGANHLEGMCLTVGIRSYLGKSLHHPLIRAVWRHNLACAMIAERLAYAGFMDKDSAYTAGMLHDIGRLAFAVLRPHEYASLLETQVGTPASILDLETEMFGCDHCQAGCNLVKEWELPFDFEAIVSNHHHPRRADGNWSMTELIKMSCKFADAAGFSAFAGCEVFMFRDLCEELPARERRAFPAELELLTAEVAGRIAAVEAL
jgi:putative nucleotidyltransferase with HDIG domain